jgi:hypothetical protein
MHREGTRRGAAGADFKTSHCASPRPGAGALKLMGLEFQDAEIDMMLRSVNSAV